MSQNTYTIMTNITTTTVSPSDRAEMPGHSASWKEVRDEATGSIYYYNSVTSETSWDRPIELSDDKENEVKDVLPVQRLTAFIRAGAGAGAGAGCWC